jgi:hypothetical protein
MGCFTHSAGVLIKPSVHRVGGGVVQVGEPVDGLSVGLMMITLFNQTSSKACVGLSRAARTTFT